MWSTLGSDIGEKKAAEVALKRANVPAIKWRRVTINHHNHKIVLNKGSQGFFVISCML